MVSTNMTNILVKDSLPSYWRKTNKKVNKPEPGLKPGLKPRPAFFKTENPNIWAGPASLTRCMVQRLKPDSEGRHMAYYGKLASPYLNNILAVATNLLKF